MINGTCAGVTRTAAASGAIRVVAARSLEALDGWRPELEALNQASRRPSPFASLTYLRTFVAHDERTGFDTTPLLLLAFDGQGLVGFLPMRRLRGSLMGLPADRLQFLVQHDIDRPGLVCLPEDEQRCAQAFVHHLVTHEEGWSQIEWTEQDAASPLAEAAARLPGFFVRRFPNYPNATLPLPDVDPVAWFRGLSRNFRGSIRASVGRLPEDARVQFVWSETPEATRLMLEQHRRLEDQGWKGSSGAGIGRSSQRLAFFRELADGRTPLRLSVHQMLVDGVPVASEVNGRFGGTLYALETAFDEGAADLRPGHLLFLATVTQATARGCRSINLMGNFADLKRRYGATVTETVAVQVYRPGSVLWARAHLGDLRRSFGSAGGGKAVGDCITRSQALGALAIGAPRRIPPLPPVDYRGLVMLRAVHVSDGAMLRRLVYGKPATVAPPRRAPLRLADVLAA